MRRLAALGAKRLYDYCKKHFDEKVLDQYGSLFEKSFLEEGFTFDIDQLFPGETIQDARCYMVEQAVDGNEIARAALELAVLQYIDKSAPKLYARIVPGMGDGVTLEFAAKVCGFRDISDRMDQILDAYNRVELLLSSEEEKSDLPRVLLKVEYPLACFLSGIPVADSELKNYCDEYWPDENVPVIFGIEDEVKELCETTAKFVATLTDEEMMRSPITVVITGEKESGRRRVMERLCHYLGMSVLIVEAEFLLKSRTPRRLLRKLFLHCYLMNTALCVHGLPKAKDDNTDVLIREIRKAYNAFGARPLFLLCDEGVKPLHFLPGKVIPFHIAKTNHKIAYELWEGFLKEYDLLDYYDVTELASKMNLKAGQIRRIVEQMDMITRSSGFPPLLKRVYQICYDVLDDGRYENIKQVESEYTLDDVKISAKNRKILQAICDQVVFNNRIYHEWGMRKKYEYGRCVSVIMAGPPGTGKTMAVHALANALDLRLYKVDLSQMVDKYVGETEKRLEEVFQKAEKSHMILFFDEADAIMGKRTETSDSKDKYANTEIAYILQRIEEYDGIVILSTNYLRNIDTAFMRRIKYVVHFELPDEETRLEIWKTSFAPEVPLDADIDWKYLAKEFNISGGSIKNIVLNATFMAAAEEKNVGMLHIMKAVALENAKDNRVSFASDYGDYSFLVRGY